VTTESILAALGIYAGTFAIAAMSSLVPIVLVEVFLIAVAGSASAPLLVACAAAGNLVGKLPIYAAARAAGTLRVSQRLRVWIERWSDTPRLVLAASAVFGLPPFSIMATAAGVLAIRTRAFCAIVFCGRALRFAIVLAIALH
jgi:membrane protein YqaA with SNARE-associated domain